ncbi:ChaN family lipoprotein [Methylacidimicrobium sp. B4]|uniref:ChaN family lipoprotein n=1 Tax=Methylacidimicrobium sp. B4 TaxID=2796139 RepID=UPI001A8D8548|nr:ChaN family lipoprotein [Methylacidimicrobium sp. B4]QSR84066.1 ChaN family lipoprotein [Methylacidimicrobium sp. B4]
MLSLRETLAALTLLLLCYAGKASGQGWIDLLAGEPVSDADLLSDLQNARIIYLGEMHTAPSHHRIEERLLRSLAAGNAPLSLFLEALDAKDSPVLSRFLAGALSFEEFAQEIDWPRRWSNYQDYRGLCLGAREKRVRVLGLDGPPLLFHRIARQGWRSVPPAERERLGLNQVRFDPLYQRLLQLFLPIHRGMGRSWQVRAAEAQEVRDDWMAERIVEALRTTHGRKERALVVCGAGHLRFGLGLPEHVARRLSLPQRILLLAPPPERARTSGLPLARRAAAPPPLSHAALAFVDRPLADYLWLPPRAFPVKNASRSRNEAP